MSRGQLRFIHASNVCVDHQFCQTGPLPEQVRETVRDATTNAFTSLIDACLEQDVDFLLLTGDSFDVGDRSLWAGAQLREGFSRLAEYNLPVVIVADGTAPLSAWKAVPGLPNNITILDPTRNTPVSVRRDEQVIAKVVTVHGMNAISAGNSRGQAHFSATTLSTEHANTRGKMSQTPTCERLPKVNVSLPAQPQDRRASEFHSHNNGPAAQHAAADAFSIGITRFPISERQWKPLDENAARRLDSDLEGLLKQALDGWAVDYLAVYGSDERFSCSFQDCFVHNPGGTQGLNPQQTGPHGGTLVEVNENGRIATRFLPTAIVRWERLRVELGDVTEQSETLRRMRSALNALRPEVQERVWFIEWAVAIETQYSASDRHKERMTSLGFRDGLAQDAAARGRSTPAQSFVRTLYTDGNPTQFLRLLDEEMKDFHDVVLLHRMPGECEHICPSAGDAGDSLARQFLEQLAQFEATPQDVLQRCLDRAKQIDSNLVEQLDELTRTINPSDILSQARKEGTSWMTETHDAA